MPADLRQLTDRERAIISKYRPQHGSVMAPMRTIADSTGAIGSPLVVLDTIDRMERRGTLESHLADAGREFARLFRRAHLDALKAADMSRIPAAGGYREPGLPHGAEAARRRVNEIMAELGGMTSIVGSIIWHVVGLEWSVRRWALETRRHNEGVACGILIAALSALEMRLRGA